MDAQPLEFVSFESSNEEVPLYYHPYMAPSQDHKDGDATMLNPRLVLRMHMERAEVPWSDLCLNRNHKVISLLINGL